MNKIKIIKSAKGFVVAAEGFVALLVGVALVIVVLAVCSYYML